MLHLLLLRPHSSSHPLIPPPTFILWTVFSHYIYPFINPHVLPPFRQTCYCSLPSSPSHLSYPPTYPTPTLPSHSPPSLPRCQARLHQRRAGSMAGSPSLTGNYTAEQQLPLRWAWETEMQKLWKQPIGKEGGGDGEAINRADWSWISSIG